MQLARRPPAVKGQIDATGELTSTLTAMPTCMNHVTQLAKTSVIRLAMKDQTDLSGSYEMLNTLEFERTGSRKRKKNHDRNVQTP